MSGLSQEHTLEIVSRHGWPNELQTAQSCLQLGQKKLDWLLRDHTLDRRHWVTNRREINKRNAFDRTLEGISALTVVWIGTGTLPMVPTDLQHSFHRILSNPAVASYYGERYPLALPVLFWHKICAESLRHIAGTHQATIQSKRDNLPFLVAFFELDGRLEREQSLCLFLNLLDDFNFEDIELGDILRIVGDPTLYQKYVLGDSRKYEREQRGVEGMEAFLVFCSDLDRLLDGVADQPLFRAAIWLHFCYWFGNGGAGVRRTASELHKSLGRWANLSPSRKHAQLVRMKVDSSSVLLKRLTDWKKYALPLIDSVAPLLDNWALKQSCPK